jgi:serine/threonine protein kinase
MAKNVFRELRDGGWKQKSVPGSSRDNGNKCTVSGDAAIDENSVGAEKTDSSVCEEEDLRIEGTTAYLPPEVIMGAFPTTAADAWALGCVMYQCLSGRPPILEADDEATKHRIVSFDATDATENEIDRLFQDKHASGIISDAQDLIRCLLNREPKKRPRMNEIAEHPFFPFNVFELYSKPAYPLDVGNVAPSPDARWSRRQFSSIWAPQPEAYNLALPDSSILGNNGLFSIASSQVPIMEGEECVGFFSPSGTSSTSAGAFGKRSDRSTLIPPA